MVEYKELRRRCLLHHWLDLPECQLLVLMQAGTYSKYEVICCEKNCPIKKMVGADNEP